MRTLMMAAVGWSLLVLAEPASGQGEWAVELRVGPALPMQDIGDELDTGFGFEVTARYSFLPYLAAYAGWDWMRFSSATSLLGEDLDFEETGYAFGVVYERAFVEDGSLGWWLRGGGTFDHVELEDADGDEVGDSGHLLGFEVGGGVAFQLTEEWSVTPGVRYRSLSPELETPSASAELDFVHLTLEVGVVWSR